MDNTSVMEGVFSFLGTLPQGHDKPVKHAIYNALAIFLVVVCCAAAWALFIILEPFVKPLTWAVLVGSVLHPFKYSLAQRFRHWMQAMDQSGTPVIIGLLLVPFKVANNISDTVSERILVHWKAIIAVTTLVLCGHGVYFLTPKFLFSIACNVYSLGGGITYWFINIISITILLSLFVVYLAFMFLLWTPENNYRFHIAAIGLWGILSAFVANSCSIAFQVPVFVTLQFIFIGGFIFEIYKIYDEVNTIEESTVTLVDAFVLVFKSKSEYKAFVETIVHEKQRDTTNISGECGNGASTTKSTIRFSDDVPRSSDISRKPKNLNIPVKEDSSATKTSLIITDRGRIHLVKQPSSDSNLLQNDPSKLRRSMSQPAVAIHNMSMRAKLGLWNWKRKASKSLEDQAQNGDEWNSKFYIYAVIWACVIMLCWKNIMLLPILPIPIGFGIIKQIGTYFGLWDFISNASEQIYNATYEWCCERYDGLFPVPVRGIYHTVVLIHRYIKHTIKESIDTVASCLVILGLIVFVILSSIFIFIQIYAEAIMLVQMTSNVINQTVVHNPELRQLFPPTFDDTVDSILDNAYQYGRTGISNLVKSVMTDADPDKSLKLEQQVLELWDRVYQTWMSSEDDNGPKVTSNAVQTSWNAFLEDLQRSPEMFNLNGIMSFLKQNIGTLMSLMDSVWTIVIGNISLVVGSFSALVSILLGGGTAVLNFILNVIIFLTTLFYLLSSSGRLYKPIELLTNFSSGSSRFGLALGDAINGVFIASFKMATFYGLWTWLIHNMFGLKIIYLPSAFATILGAAPFLGTYWACIPGVLDLWLAQGNSVKAILFAIMQFLPTSIVDTTIYGEIKGGGHPYLTGLAIAGGIFCLGLEGAIIGPLVLCALYVGVDLSTSLFKDSPSEETLNLQQLSRLQLQSC